MARSTTLQQAYASEKYQRFRQMIIGERGPVCEYCGKLITEPLDLQLHHTPIELTEANCMDAAVLLNPANVKIACHSCHDIHHQRYGNDEARRVYIVYGPPLSGKSTFVRQQARRGDLIVDVDRIYEALSLMPAHDKPNNLLSLVLGVRDLLLDNIKTRHGKWRNAFVIGGYPDRHAREQLAADLGAELVYCEASREECLACLAADEGRSEVKSEYQAYIENWFARYTE